MSLEYMSDHLNYIGPDELVFHNDADMGVHSGGFSINSIFLKGGISPIMTINTNPLSGGGGGGEKVSDLFQDLVVPNWVLSYNNRMNGGAKYHEVSDSDSDDGIIHDDLHDQLLEMVKQHNRTRKPKVTRRAKSTSTRQTKRRR